MRQTRPGRSPGSVTVSPQQLRARRLLAGVARVRAQRVEVVDVQLGVEPVAGRQLAEPLEHRALLAGHARDADERRRVVGERVAVDHAASRRLGPAHLLAARVDHRGVAQAGERRHRRADAPVLLDEQRRAVVEARASRRRAP